MKQPLADNELHSALYEGTVRHRRYTPKTHAFTYKVFMVYLDLQELDHVFSQSPWWSQRYFSLAWFRRRDFFDGKDNTSLYHTVADKVEQQTGRRPQGAIRMLTNLRYFGFIINPITCYYCFDQSGEYVETVVAEVTNTPWRQRCHYVLNFNAFNADAKQAPQQLAEFDKNMHVSPFQPMDLKYTWQGNKPDQQLCVHLDVKNRDPKHNNNTVFDATLQLTRQEMNAKNMNQKIFRYPWMTLKVFAAIYWQAMRLWLKKVPFYHNPPSSSETNNPTI